MNNEHKHLGLLTALAGFLCLSVTAFSQNTESSIDTSKVYELQEVIISAGRFEETPSTVGRNVTVITRKEIENSAYTNVGEVLARQQSMHIVGDNQTPGSLIQGFLRNSNSNHFIVMIDGVRISDPSSTNNGVNLTELSLLGVERIEMVRGSHSTLYGSSAIGGVINIITQKQGVRGFNVDVDTKHGIFGSDTYSTSNIFFSNVTMQNGLYIDAGLAQQFTNGLDATIDTVSNPDAFNPQDGDDFRKLDLLGKVGYKNSATDLFISYRNVDQRSDLDQGSYADDDNARIDFQRNLLNYGGTHRLSDRFELRLEGAYSNLSRDFVNDSSVVNRQGNYDGTYTETNAEGTLWENELTGFVNTRYAKFIVGLESSVQTMATRTYTFVRPFNFESATDLDSLDLKETINSGFIHTELNGGFISEFAEPFSLVLGTRLFDHNKFGTYATYEINPKVQVARSALVYGAVTTGFNAPSLYQLHTPEKGFGAFTSRGNANLEPETSVSYELGWKQDIGNIIEFNLSLFKTNVRDVIEYVYLWDGSKEIDNLGFQDYLGDTYINVSRQEINGLEFGLDVQPVSQFSFGGNITLTRSTLGFAPEDINRSYTGGNHVQIFESGQFVNSEKELEGLTRRPQASALLRAGYRPVKQVGINLTSRFVGARDDIFYSASLGPFGALDRSKIEGYNLTDVSVRYQVNNNLSLVGKVENLFDTGYQEINGYNTRGRGFFLKGSLSL